jgi:hypothetical protein
MAAMFATKTKLNYQAGVDSLIGIENLPGKCRAQFMDVLQDKNGNLLHGYDYFGIMSVLH